MPPVLLYSAAKLNHPPECLNHRMGILNPKLLSDDLRRVLDEAALLRNRYRQPQLVPALVLLAMLRQNQNAAHRLLRPLVEKGITELKALERQLEQTLRTQRELDGKLFYKTESGLRAGLSRQTVIMLDEALSIANAREENSIDTDHVLLVMTESQLNTSYLFKTEWHHFPKLGDFARDQRRPAPPRCRAIYGPCRGGEDGQPARSLFPGGIVALGDEYCLADGKSARHPDRSGWRRQAHARL